MADGDCGACAPHRRGLGRRRPNPGKAKAQFTAVLLLEKQVKPSFSQLQAELKRIAPQAVLGDWGGTVTNPAVDPGIDMLSLDGEYLSVLFVRRYQDIVRLPR